MHPWLNHGICLESWDSWERCDMCPHLKIKTPQETVLTTNHKNTTRTYFRHLLLIFTNPFIKSLHLYKCLRSQATCSTRAAPSTMLSSADEHGTGYDITSEYLGECTHGVITKLRFKIGDVCNILKRNFIWISPSDDNWFCMLMLPCKCNWYDDKKMHA